MVLEVSFKIQPHSWLLFGSYLSKLQLILGCEIEHKTCDILAAERLRLMRFDNQLIIDSLKVVSVTESGKEKQASCA